nr:PIN domain-containing protein [Sphingomonas trueperi]
MLDTNVWSVLRKPEGNREIVQWITERMTDIWLSVIVIAEIRAGIENLDASKKREALEGWLADLEILYSERTLPFDTAAAHGFGTLIAQRKLAKQETKLLDLQIAAQALSRNCPVATRNVRDFAWTGVKLIDPWTA